MKRSKGAAGQASFTSTASWWGQVDMPITNPILLELADGDAVGVDAGSPVTLDRYESPFVYTGTLYSVTLDVSGELITDIVAEMQAIMARQ